MATKRKRPGGHQVSSIGEKAPPSGIGHTFTRGASAVSSAVGNPWSFLIALGVVIVWAVSGPIFNFSSDWQLVINTGTTIVTFLMVFLIQNTQNRDARAIHLKLDELLRAVPEAREEFMEAEEEDLDEIEREKEIVDREDPAPPEHKKAEREKRGVLPSNGKTHASSGNGKSERHR